MKRYNVVLTLLILFSFVMNLNQFVEAGFITIETKATVNIDKDTIKSTVEVTNKGDEAAYNVRITADIGGKLLKGTVKDVLKVNEKHSEEFTTEAGFKKAGRYPVIVTIEYTDQNQYPFTALSIVDLVYKENVITRVSGQLIALEVMEKGNLKVKVKNLEDIEKKVNILLVIPKELSSPNRQKEVVIKGGAEETVKFDIRNLAALLGSNYVVYAVLQYEDDNYHYTNSTRGNIKIEEKKEIVKFYRWPLVALAVLLIFAVLYINLRKKRV